MVMLGNLPMLGDDWVVMMSGDMREAYMGMELSMRLEESYCPSSASARPLYITPGL